ncbi:hypothetical protein DPMN_150365 [Dreissena polymorpha]|uniref:Uncharacterized protein n=1 Tax=Dreissena polymorpha TaxID=45954 RepID=A0A9D4FD79_DREPO|nr:hypothetical protein DPMN_150365 [Dreissena polymorpha]
MVSKRVEVGSHVSISAFRGVVRGNDVRSPESASSAWMHFWSDGGFCALGAETNFCIHLDYLHDIRSR